MKEKTFQRNKKKMGHLRQLILFEKSYLFKRYNNCLYILNVAAEVLCIFGHRNKQKKKKQTPNPPPPLEKMNWPI